MSWSSSKLARSCPARLRAPQEEARQEQELEQELEQALGQALEQAQERELEQEQEAAQREALRRAATHSHLLLQELLKMENCLAGWLKHDVKEMWRAITNLCVCTCLPYYCKMYS